TFLTDAHSPFLFTVGTALQSTYLIGFVFVVLAFPTGRLRGRVDRAIVWLGAALATLVEFVSLLLSDSDAVLCSGCPRNVLELQRDDGLANGILQGQRLTGVALALSVANDVAGGPLGQAAKWALFAVFATVPVAVLVVLLQHRLARSAVADLVVELGAGTQGVDLRDALSRALGDPALELAFWFPAGGRYVDRDGQPVALPGPDADRVATLVERDGQPIAALVHDAALKENADLVASVCAAAALTLENERLEAELRARLAELQASRARLVE